MAPRLGFWRRRSPETERAFDMINLKVIALALFATMLAAAPAKAFCLFACEPTAEDTRKLFENLVRKKFDVDAIIQDFPANKDVMFSTRSWIVESQGIRLRRSRSRESRATHSRRAVL